ncbi:hypothetical protein [Lawsonibacter faecis]|nr:hypothetical protein [Lawsonibacter faecis]
MQTAQWLLIRHGILPGTYYRLSDGEKLLIRGLLTDYLEGRE